jgi:hypothetical protein
VTDEDILEAAAAWAGEYVAPLGRRWQHVRAVASKAARVATTFSSNDAGVLVAAAWLHDIGYAGDLALSGFHPLDGGRFVRARGVEDRVALLVANHSGARVEAELRGIEGYAAEFPFIDDALDAALTYCDLTTGPDGLEMSLHRRVAEISDRYGRDHVTARAVTACVWEFERMVAETEARIACAGSR